MQFLVNGRYMYEKKNVSRGWLREKGFQYNHDLSDSEVSIFTLRFPLHKYKKFVTLEGELAIDVDNGGVNVNAYMPNTNDPYPPFYYIPCGVYDPLMKEITNRINTEFRRLGITKRKRAKDAKNSKI